MLQKVITGEFVSVFGRYIYMLLIVTLAIIVTIIFPSYFLAAMAWSSQKKRPSSARHSAAKSPGRTMPQTPEKNIEQLFRERVRLC